MKYFKCVPVYYCSRQSNCFHWWVDGKREDAVMNVPTRCQYYLEMSAIEIEGAMERIERDTKNTD